MAEYLIQSETLISIADEVRELNGITGTMGLNVMKTNLCNANDEVNTQTELIAQIVNTIEGKAAGAAQATPIITVNKSNGLITATAGSKSSTYQLAFQPAKTITPSTTSQIAVSRGYYTGGSVTVAAVPTQTKTVTPTSSTQNVTPDSGKFLSKVTVNAIPSTYIRPSYTKAAATYTPTTANQTISAGTYLTGTQTIKGDSNLVAGNIKSGVSIFGVNGTYEGSGGDTSLVDSLLLRTITSYTSDSLTEVGSGAFAYCSSLTSVNFPAVTTIGINAFTHCDNLTSVSFPAATDIFESAFFLCRKITSISCPDVEYIGSSAFAYTNLTSAIFPVTSWIGSGAFYYCINLTSISFPAATTISGSAFHNCSGLTSVNFPAVTTIGSSAFTRYYNLTSASFPAATTIFSSAFYLCYNLKSLYLIGSSL